MYSVAYLMREQSRYLENVKKQTAFYRFRLVHTALTYCLFHFFGSFSRKMSTQASFILAMSACSRVTTLESLNGFSLKSKFIKSFEISDVLQRRNQGFGSSGM